MKTNKAYKVAFIIVVTFMVAVLMYCIIDGAYSKGKADGIKEHTMYVNDYETTYREADYIIRSSDGMKSTYGGSKGTTHMIKEEIMDEIYDRFYGDTVEVTINWK